MGVARDLRHSGCAAGVEARRNVIAPDAATADQPIAWLPFELAGEWQHVVGECLLLSDGEHGAQTRHVSTKRFDPLPERQAERMPERRSERHQHLRLDGIQDVRHLVRLEQRIHRVHDAGGLAAPDRVVRFEQVRQDVRDDVGRSDAQRVERVGGLRHLVQQPAVRDLLRGRGRVAVGQECKRDRVGRALRRTRDHLVRAVKTSEPFLERHRLDCLDVGQRAYLECLHQRFPRRRHVLRDLWRSKSNHHPAPPIVTTASVPDRCSAAASLSVPR